MATKIVDLGKVELNLTELLTLTRQGVEILLVENDAPLARLIPETPVMRTRVPGLNPGAITTSDDFDAPLPDDFWTGLG